jgi:hypothetical protein
MTPNATAPYTIGVAPTSVSAEPGASALRPRAYRKGPGPARRGPTPIPSTLHRVVKRDPLRSNAVDRIAVSLGRASVRAVDGVVPRDRRGDPTTAGPAALGPVLTVEEAAAHLRMSLVLQP